MRGLRPTPDRVRETLFNWLRDDVAGAHCLDLFAGSGALGFEAVSRGAASLVAVERHREVARRLRDNAELLRESGKIVVVQSEVTRFLQRVPERPFDIVFADPPFADHQLAAVCRQLATPGWLNAGAVIYLEQDAKRGWDFLPAAWRTDREGRAGQTAQRLLRCSTVD